MLKILKFWSPYFLKISCPPLFKVKYLKIYSMEMKIFFFHLKLMKLPSISNILFPWRPLSPKIKVNWILKNTKKTVIFLFFAYIKRHNSKFLIKFGHNNIGSWGFRMQSVLLENLSPLTFYRPLNWENTFYLLPKKFVDRKKLFNPFW